MIDKERVGEIFRRKRKFLQMTLAEVARKMDYDTGNLSRFETGKQSMEFSRLSKLADILDIPINQVLREEEFFFTDNVRPASGGAKVPLIKIEEVINWTGIDPETPKTYNHIERWISCPSKHGPNSYALRVSGDAMTSSHGKSYPPGCIIFVDPSQATTARSGDQIIARMHRDNSIVFKSLILDAGAKFLRSLNTAYPTIDAGFDVMGKVIGKYECEDNP